MKVYIDKDEWWPVFCIDCEPNRFGETKEVPDELVKKYKENLEEFNKIQKELGNIYHNDQNP